MNLDSFFILANKPVGLTSQQLITQFKKKFHYKKVGHHGTLDPFASGCLLLGIGEATKFFPYLNDERKTYTATLKLGEKTDTLDHTGKCIETRSLPRLSQEKIAAVLAKLIGKIEQTPPMFSAVQVGGERLYTLARKGQTVERKSRQVIIHDLRFLNWESPYLTFEAEVSRGTYIRVLAEQIAEQLQNVAHLTKLERIALCNLKIEEAFDCERNGDDLEKYKICISDILEEFPIVTLNASQAKLFLQGQTFKWLEAMAPSNFCRIFHHQQFLGLACLQENLKLKPERVMQQGLINISD